MEREAHRAQFTDLEWAGQQPQGPPNYRVGDIMEFKAGGYGRIHEVQNPQSGWPSKYATDEIEGFEDHPLTKRAWHYELDFKRRV